MESILNEAMILYYLRHSNRNWIKIARYSDIRYGLDHITSNAPTNNELFGSSHFKSTCEACTWKHTILNKCYLFITVAHVIKKISGWYPVTGKRRYQWLTNHSKSFASLLIQILFTNHVTKFTNLTAAFCFLAINVRKISIEEKRDRWSSLHMQLSIENSCKRSRGNKWDNPSWHRNIFTSWPFSRRHRVLL